MQMLRRHELRREIDRAARASLSRLTSSGERSATNAANRIRGIVHAEMLTARSDIASRADRYSKPCAAC
jgi:vacuolar-type H+-ATPase subunit E/Vma4